MNQGLNGLYGCVVCVEIAYRNKEKDGPLYTHWPLYTREQVTLVGHEFYCKKHFQGLRA